MQQDIIVCITGTNRLHRAERRLAHGLGHAELAKMVQKAVAEVQGLHRHN